MFQGKVILVVDDESDLREILRDELRFEHATVFEASNGSEAQKMLNERKFDAVLSDIRMPGGDGATLANRIRERDPASPIVILITGFADLRSEDAYAMGADGYVLKPFHLEELKANIQRLLQNPELRWGQNPVLNPKRKIIIPETFEHWIQSERFHIGRGGLYLQTPADQSRIGDVVEVQFADMKPLQAWIRWIHHDPRIEAQGLGLEFLHVPPRLLELLENRYPEWKSSKSFIPSHSELQ